MESGDYGAVRNPTISKDATKPDMVVISVEHQVSALEEMNWQGFSSEQLWYGHHLTRSAPHRLTRSRIDFRQSLK